MDYDISTIELQESIESLEYINTYISIESLLTDTKLRMITRLNNEIKYTNNTTSMENYLDHSMESVINSLVNGIFKIITTILKSILNLIGKVIGFIMHVVLELLRIIVHKLTAPKKVPKEKQNKIMHFIYNFKSSENYFSLEDNESNKNIQPQNKIGIIVKLLESKVSEITNYVQNNKNNFIKSFYSEIMNCNDINSMCACMDKKEQQVDSLFSKNLYDTRDSIFKLGRYCVDALKTHRNIDLSVRNECIDHGKQLTDVIEKINNFKSRSRELSTKEVIYKLASISFSDNFTSTCKQFISKFESNTNKHLKDRIRYLEKELIKLKEFVEDKIDVNFGNADHIKNDLNVFKSSMQNFSSACIKILNIDTGVKNMNIKILNTMVTFVDSAAKI